MTMLEEALRHQFLNDESSLVLIVKGTLLLNKGDDSAGISLIKTLSEMSLDIDTAALS
jgi:hypothetical protein